MKTKLVYVLTSDLQDYYLEMTYISVYSARLHNPDAHIALVTEEHTIQTCRGDLRKDFLNLFDEIKVVADASTFESKSKRSRYLKTSLRSHVDGDYLFIDSDTVVCGSLAEIDAMECSIGMVRDSHLTKEQLSRYLPTSTIKTFGMDLPVKDYFNSGVVFVRDCEESHIFYSQWYKNWNSSEGKERDHDQQHFHRALLQTSIQISELNGIWNCQLFGSFLPYFNRAKILHFSGNFFVKQLYALADDEVLKEVRSNNGLTEKIKEQINYPKDLFRTGGLLVLNEDVRKLEEMKSILLLYKKSQRMYLWTERFAEFLLKVKWHKDKLCKVRK